MIAVAIAAIAVNAIIGLWLHRAARSDLNVRGAYIHMLGDAASALGVLSPIPSHLERLPQRCGVRMVSIAPTET